MYLCRAFWSGYFKRHKRLIQEIMIRGGFSPLFHCNKNGKKSHRKYCKRLP